MDDLSNNEVRGKQFGVRVAAAGAFVLTCFALLTWRLVELQVFHTQKYALEARENRTSSIPVVPTRGLITDRNGVVLARNYSAYTLDITRSKLQQPLERVIYALSAILPVTHTDLSRFHRLLESSRTYEGVPLLVNLTDQEVAIFAARAFEFPGVTLRNRMIRSYPLGAVGEAALGYIGRISTRDEDDWKTQRGVDLDSGNYRGTEVIGKEGVEQSYENVLHGVSGDEEMEITAGGHPVRVLKETPALPGDNLRLTLDIGLQEMAEKAFSGRRGALVAIEPDTGAILAFVSAPGFDPNLFVNGIDQENWDALNNSPDRPLLNRPLRGTYAPGSTYKPYMALAALTLHVRTRDWGFHDPGYYMFGGHKFRNDVITGQGWIDMYRSIEVSNDTYYFMLAHDLGVDAIAKFMPQWGFGHPTGIDLYGEASGVLPSRAWKQHAFHSPSLQRWYEGDTVSLGIGQGYNAYTILQLSHALATLANGGTIIAPHLGLALQNPVTGTVTPIAPKVLGHVGVSTSDIDFIKSAMVGVATQGTAKEIFAGVPYSVAAKTGTAQVVGIAANQRYNAKETPKTLRDNSLFEAFAPADHPKIAIALVVENGGWGASSAGPIVRQLLDYYLVTEKQGTATTLTN